VIDGVFTEDADGQVHLATLSREVGEGLQVRAAEAAALRPEDLSPQSTGRCALGCCAGSRVPAI
jgi:hypothetical protein